MKEIFFWQNWHRNYQVIYWLALFFFILSLSAYIFSYFTGNDWLIPWEVQTELKPTKQVLGEVQSGIFKIPIEGEMFLIEESFNAGTVKISPWLYSTYTLVMIAMMLLLLSVISTLRQIPFFIGIAFFVFFLITLNIDYLGLIKGSTNIGLIISLVAYLGLSFYFQTFRKDASLLFRFLTFCLITTLIASWIVYQATSPYPFMYLSAYGLLVPIILTFIFIILTANDILYTAFQLIVKYNAEGGRNNLIHFTVFTFIYLLNVVLLYAQYTDYLQLNLYYIDIYWLFLISAILGIWGFQKRSALLNQTLPFVPQGGVLYLALAVISLSTLALAFITSNDALLESFRDFMLFSHIGFGIVFYLYVVLNFSDLMAVQLPVHKIVYEGKIIPFNTLQYFGYLVIMALVYYNNFMVYYQGVGGYYNQVGDAYFANREFRLAQINYELARSNDFLNHHSNYALATLANLEKNVEAERTYLKESVRRQPSEQAYIRLANIMLNEDRNLDALLQLREGAKKLPKSFKINNNLALLYAQNKVVDSTFFHLQQAQRYAGNNMIAQNNLWAYFADNLKPGTRLETLPISKDEVGNSIGKVNKLALYNKAKTNLIFPKSPTGEKLPLVQNFAYTYNYTLNKIGLVDTLALQQLKQFNKIDTAKRYNYQTQFVEACYHYYNGNIDFGIQVLASIPVITKEPYYNTVLGLWLLEQKNYGNAQSYFQKAYELGNAQALFYYAIAKSEIGDYQGAIEAWLGVMQQKEQNPENIKSAQRVLKVLTDSVKIDDDTDRYNLLHYKAKVLPKEIASGIFAQINDPEFKTKAGADLINYFIDSQQVTIADSIYHSLKPSDKVSAFARSEINLAYLRLLTASKDYKKVLGEIDNLQMVTIHQHKKHFYRAVAYRNSGDAKNALYYYERALAATPYEAEVLIETADFYQRKQKNADKAYQVLVNGVRGNAFSLPLYQAYTLQCLEVGLDDYGDLALAEIKKQTRSEEYTAFEKIYQERKNLLNERRGIKKDN
jgi:Tfp pilus assembly protein PilF